MRVLIGLGALAAILAADVQTAIAKDRPWCLLGREGGRWCSYDTFAQCEASRRGVGGSCVENPVVAWQRAEKGSRQRPGQRRYDDWR